MIMISDDRFHFCYKIFLLVLFSAHDEIKLYPNNNKLFTITGFNVTEFIE